MKPALLVHERGHALAADIARIANMVLGPSRIVLEDAQLPSDRDASFIVLIDDTHSLSFATRFAADHADWLRTVTVALVTPGSPHETSVAILARSLDVDDVLRVVLPTPPEHKPDRIGRHDLDETVVQLSALSRARVPEEERSMHREELLHRIEAFLGAHKICIFAAASHGRVRAEPVAYDYERGHVYTLTEGGERLAHVLSNPSVALAIFEPQTGLFAPTGVELTGNARVHAPGSDEHTRLMARRELSPERVEAAEAPAFVLDVTLHRAEFFDPSLSTSGLSVRQTLVF